MQANLQDQSTLLKVSELDLEIQRIKSDQQRLKDSNQLEQLRLATLELSDQLIDVRNRLSELDLELKRSENDLEMVESRIAKDQQRLSSTSSAKDATGISHELETLLRRKSELEDAELAVMEQIETVRQQEAELAASKSEAEANFTKAEQDAQSEFARLNDVLAAATSNRSKMLSTVQPELVSAYERKAARGQAVGRLLGRDCGVCRLSITATNLDEISAMAADQFAECPNCQAYLVRS
jgi:uncharacterized protein